MAVSHKCQVVALACCTDWEDFIEVYDLSSLVKVDELWLEEDVFNVLQMAFTADDLLVVPSNKPGGATLLVDLGMRREVGYVGNPDGYIQGCVCFRPEIPSQVAVGSDSVVVSYKFHFSECCSKKFEDGCDTDNIRIFKGSRTTWVLHHVIEKRAGVSMRIRTHADTDYITMACHQFRYTCHFYIISSYHSITEGIMEEGWRHISLTPGS